MKTPKANNLKKTFSSLPLKWYYDEKQFQKELNKIWSHNWVYVCHESSLIDNLSYKTITISKQSILILKDKEGSILAYLNTSSIEVQ